MPAAEAAQSLSIADLRLPIVGWQKRFEIGNGKPTIGNDVDLKDEGPRIRVCEFKISNSRIRDSKLKQ
jgi:hypothetical protein